MPEQKHMNDPASSVTQRLDVLQKRVESACRNAGRDPAEVTLLLATKTIPADRLPEAVRAGQMRFGENRIQERSEEHTSELQSRGHLVCCLLLAKIDMIDNGQ